MKWVTAFIILLLIFQTESTNGCLIIYLSDGKQVLIGNHEDWFAKDAAVRINRPSSGKLGSVIFTFISEGWAQGGMNEKGLFFDAAHTPYQEIDFDSQLKDYPGNIWQHVLDKAASVEEALQLIKEYKLYDLRESHIMLADGDGNAALIGVDHGKVTIKRVQKSNLVQTNFNPWQPELDNSPVCWRYESAQRQLAILPDATVDNVRNILEQTYQESLTVYSNIYDLKNKTIRTYNKQNFNKVILLSLPDIFQYGDCMASLDSLAGDDDYWKTCSPRPEVAITIRGNVINQSTRQPVSFANIGLIERNVGTLSDQDGSFELTIPHLLRNEAVIFSSIGYDRQSINLSSFRSGNLIVSLKPNSVLLEAITIKATRSHKVKRLGWMGGKDGVLPLDTIQGGGAVALLVESPQSPAYIDKLQVRLMYNSKDTLSFRLHVYAFDSVLQIPGQELLSREVILKESKRFGWLRFDLASSGIVVKEKKFFIGFEWIDDSHTRRKMVAGLKEWERWKKEQFEAHNEKVERLVTKDNNGSEQVAYKYHGNMMNWAGFTTLPPFTGLMVETGKSIETKALRTFERKTSFGPWKELDSTLNAVVTVLY